jgi:hypothetical protein
MVATSPAARRPGRPPGKSPRSRVTHSLPVERWARDAIVALDPAERDAVHEAMRRAASRALRDRGVVVPQP